MKANAIIAAALMPLAAAAQSISIATSNTNAMYKIGETAVFTVTVLNAAKRPAAAGSVKITLDNSGPEKIASMEADLAKGNPATIKGALKEPGFLKCTATATVGTNRLRRVWSVAYEPTKIRQGAPRPADFDAFWDGAVAKLEKEVPLDPKMTHLKAFSNERHDAWRVSFATCNGQRVFGFLCVPKGKEGPFPVQVNVPGAGLGAYTPNTWLADEGFVSLIMCVHSFAPGKNAAEQAEFYNRQNKELEGKWGVPQYYLAGATKRESFFYYPVILGINRAVNWLWGQKYADRSHFVYSGTSQGGGFGFYLCGLNGHFTRGVSHVPALTDLLGFKRGRTSGWPRLVEGQKKEDRAAAENDVAPYFDGANFAARITCPYRVSVGFSDETCPPAAVYAGFNALKAKDKAIVHGLGMTHGVYSWIYRQLDADWVRKLR